MYELGGIQCQMTTLGLFLVPNSFSSHKTFKAFKIITLFLSHNVVEAYKNHFSVNSPGSTLLNSSLEVAYNLTRKSFSFSKPTEIIRK